MKNISLVKVDKNTKRGINFALTILSVIWIFPLLFAVIGSLKKKQEYNLTSFWVFPENINWVENLEYILEYSTVMTSFTNSLLYSVCGAVGSIIIATLAAYGLTRLRIRHKMFWFMFIYSGTIFPFQLYLIPVFSSYQKVGLYDTPEGLMIFYVAICIPFAMFVLRNFFIRVSTELSEAAKIDGASDFRTLWSIYIPMSKAPLSVVFLTQFSWCFNELMFGITFTKSNDIKPVMATISTFTGHVPAMLVACCIVSIPTVLLYSFISKNFNEGISYQGK